MIRNTIVKIVGFTKQAIQLIIILIITVAAGAFVVGAYNVPILLRILSVGWIAIQVLMVLTYWSGKDLGVKSKVLMIGQADNEKQTAGD